MTHDFRRYMGHKMKSVIRLSMVVLAFVTNCAQADIFKCIVDGKSTYQAVPCKKEKDETALNIKIHDEEAERRGFYKRREFEMMQAERRYFEAREAEERAKAIESLSRADREAAAAEASDRMADAYQQRMRSQQQVDKAYSDYLYKRGGMSPIFKR